MYALLSPLLLFPVYPDAARRPVDRSWHRRAEPAIRFAVCWLLPAWLDVRDRPDQAVALHPAHLRRDRASGRRRLDPADRQGFTHFRRPARPVRRRRHLRHHRLWPDRVRSLDGPDLGHRDHRLRRHGGGGRRLPLVNRAAITGVLAAILCGVIAHAGLAGTIRQLRPLSIAPRLVKTLESAELEPGPGSLSGAGGHRLP